MTTEVFSRAITAYEHCERMAGRTVSALELKGFTEAANLVRSLQRQIQQAGQGLRYADETATQRAAIKKALEHADE